MSVDPPPSRISVVIPTRDRPVQLGRCLAALLPQCGPGVEVIIVNDGVVPVTLPARSVAAPVTLVQGESRGPAAARNRGVARARGEVVLFTDDDAVPQPGWVSAALRILQEHPEAVGVTGKVTSPPFDSLYEHSVTGDALGNFLTCNVAYRRAQLSLAGGFDEGFFYPHCEDRDLGYRMQALGEVIYSPDMAVAHTPRPVRVREALGAGRLVLAEWRLHEKHPQTRPPRWSVRWGPVIRVARAWQGLWREERQREDAPYRRARLLTRASLSVCSGLLVTLVAWRRHPLPLGPAGGEGQGLRIAWIGPEPIRGSGVAGCAWLILRGLVSRGCTVDCFLEGPPTGDIESRLPGSVRVVPVETGWRYGKWYSRHRASKLVTGLLARGWARRRAAALLEAQHRAMPYDVIYQFSMIERFGLNRRVSELPPVLLQPSTHMAGELRWLLRERRLAWRSEAIHQWFLAWVVLALRARRQARDIEYADHVVALADSFATALTRDYAVPRSRLTVVPNPIDLEYFSPRPREPDGVWRIGFVARISSRKGVETVVALSHRLADLEGKVYLELVGDSTLWSDYRPLLTDLHPGIGSYRGPMQREELRNLLQSIDLLVHPAKYEPFGLVVGEALACGVPVVATTAVGAAEGVDEACCSRVPVADAAALDRAVRDFLNRFEQGELPDIRGRARAEAERLFDSELIAHRVADVLDSVANRLPGA